MFTQAHKNRKKEDKNSQVLGSWKCVPRLANYLRMRGFGVLKTFCFLLLFPVESFPQDYDDKSSDKDSAVDGKLSI